MRPVDKGKAPKEYKTYGEAKFDLVAKIGNYCSYCEMKVNNMLEVEHIIPRDNGGDKVSWDNFLISCKYCNTVKSNNNLGLDDYLWPDRDNTDLAFQYSESEGVQIVEGLTEEQKKCAKNTIDLLGLNRFPGGEVEPTFADTRWRSRQASWNSAKRSLSNWKIHPCEVLAQQIADTALSCGNYSIWMTVFADIPEVCNKIDEVYIGTFKKYDSENKRIIRDGGII